MAKKTEAAEVKLTDKASIEAEIATKLNDMHEAKRSLVAGDLLNPRVITHTRRDIARLKTKLRELELTAKEIN